MISMIKTRTKNYPLASALLLVAIFTFILLFNLGLLCTSDAEASGPPILGDIEVGSKVSEDGVYGTTLSVPYIGVYPQFYYIDGENWPAVTAINLEIRAGEGGALLFESDTTTDGEGYFFFDLWNDPDRIELSPGQYVIIEDADGTIKTHIVKDLIITDVDMADNKVYGAAENSANTVLVEIRGDYDVNPVATATFPGGGTVWEADFSATGIDYSTVLHLRAAELDDDGDRTYQYWGPPHFFIDHHADDLWGYRWSEDGAITVQITYAGTSEETPFEIWPEENGDFWVNLRDDYSYDVSAGDILELTQGSATLTHTIMDLNVENIIPINDTVSGTADPDYDVIVEIHDNDPDYYVKASRTITPESNGEWIAVFDPGDIEPGSYGSAEQSYDLSAATRVHWHIPNPHFLVSPDNGNIWGHDWDCGAEITITINDGDTYTVTAGDQPWGGCSDFEFHDETLNLIPGDKVFVTDSITEKTHYIIDFEITEIDTTAKTVSGTAVEDTKLWVGIHEIEESHHEVTAVGGTWIADFSAYDFGPGTGGFAEQWDEDGDITLHDWHIPNPFFMVARDGNSIWGHEWAANTGVTVTIDNAPTPFNTSTDEWGNFDLGDLAGYEIQVGDIVTVSDGVSGFSHTVTNIQITEIDKINSIIRGAVEPGSTNQVEVEIHGLGEALHPRRLVTPDPLTGEWEANFAVAGEGDCPCYQEIYIFGPDSHGSADELDSEANARTRVHWHIPNPHFRVNPEDGSIWGHEWACDADIEISINDELFATVQAGNMPWGSCSDFEFHDETLEFEVGDKVTISDGDSTKTHFILYLEITEVDVTNNTVSGKAQPGRIVEVDIHDDMNWPRRETLVGENGDWSVNFTDAIGDEPWQQGHDIQPYDPLSAEIKDDDGDATHIYWHIPQPFFMVDPYHNDIWGHNWPNVTQLTVTIGDPADPDWSENVLTDNEGNFFDLWGISYDIVAGHLVTVTDGAGLTKQHIVTNLRDIEVDTEVDIVTGWADPFDEVEVHIHLDNYHIGRTVEADELGYWEADFSVPGSGDCPCEQETHDLGPGSHGSAQQSDDDRDETRIHWGVPMPFFNVKMQDDFIWGHHWPSSAELDITVKDGEAGSILHATTAFTSEDGDFELGLSPFNIEPGHWLIVSHVDIVKTHEVRNLVVTSVDTLADTVSGTTDQDSLIRVGAWSYDDNFSLEVEAGLGSWAADFSSYYDIKPGSFGGVWQEDEDGDSTWVDWQVLIGEIPTRVGVHRDNSFYLDADGDLNFDAAIDRFSNFGTPDDVPVIGDWNGDGYDQIGIRRDNTFYLDYNDNMAWEYPGDIFGNFGVASDIVLIGDWNGDGKDQVGVWREGTFYLDYDGNLDFDPSVDKMYSFGASDGTPIIGDWNGDGKDQIGVRHGSIFYLDYDGDGAWDPAHDKMGSFGLATDKILIGDWNGDGKDQIGVHRDNTFYLDYDGDLNFNAAIDKFANFGTPDDIPIIGDWNGDGIDQIGIRRGPTFYLDYNNNMAWEYPGDIFGNYGISTDEILLGKWDPGL